MTGTYERSAIGLPFNVANVLVEHGGRDDRPAQSGRPWKREAGSSRITSMISRQKPGA